MTMYFIADVGNAIQMAEAENYLDNFLIPINNIMGNESNVKYIDKLLELKKNVLIDSGIFNLANEYAKENGIPLEVAFSTDPKKFEGFDKLYHAYIEYISEKKDALWGYIEIDIGGQENKIRIRGELEALGLRPIPVYHPISDDYDYFDQLAEEYNRICIGNIVSLDNGNRLKVLCDLCERRKKYPNLWIHYLGLTLCQYCFVFPVDSCDSSKWSGSVRWNKIENRFMLRDCAPVKKEIVNYNHADKKEMILKISSMVCVSMNLIYENYSRELNGYQ